jgi:hypothetical protein
MISLRGHHRNELFEGVDHSVLYLCFGGVFSRFVDLVFGAMERERRVRREEGKQTNLLSNQG